MIAIDMNEQRLQYARDKIGVDYTVKAGENAVMEVGWEDLNLLGLHDEHQLFRHDNTVVRIS